MSIEARTSPCDPFLYEADNSGFAAHLVEAHGVPADYVAHDAAGYTQGSWLALYRMHVGVLDGRYLPRHRKPEPADSIIPIVAIEPRHRAEAKA